MIEEYIEALRVKEIQSIATWQNMPQDDHPVQNYRVYNHPSNPHRVDIGGQWFLLHRNKNKVALKYINGWLYYLDPNQE